MKSNNKKHNNNNEVSVSFEANEKGCGTGGLVVASSNLVAPTIKSKGISGSYRSPFSYF